MTHLELRGRWQQVLITDNPFKQVRVSPYAFAARIAHADATSSKRSASSWLSSSSSLSSR